MVEETTDGVEMPWDSDLVGTVAPDGTIIYKKRSEIKEEIFTAISEGRFDDAAGRYKVWSRIGGEVLPPDEIKIQTLQNIQAKMDEKNMNEANIFREEITTEITSLQQKEA